jgi:hypothetical protein
MDKNKNWKALVDASYQWKPHVGLDYLLDGVEQDLQDRDTGHEPNLHKENLPTHKTAGRNEIHMDLPGMLMLNRKVREVEVDGLFICMPSQDWTNLLARFKLEKVRRFSDGTEYYKIHDRYYCLVLTVGQRNSLVAQMEAQKADADAEGEEDDRRFVEALDKVEGVISAKAEKIKAADPKKMN